ncbi:isochorismate synthase [Luteipulveratus sp. YIM 133132]|uniref:isochorismate synthase n=1 Tax=Luteipulveratus flavus TaxID=3031728 RepID=A0ABT6C7R2_9MICO|nr:MULTISPECIES: isochorismate synthase [unclassified Luteipulveratus]MDE9365096.1 isochorismate synthase [Luteipulveratus sp. YIM 133132]MDF8264568.1 isochorismate synthase [Luteipulveratus sp. YIM 133296]
MTSEPAAPPSPLPLLVARTRQVADPGDLIDLLPRDAAPQDLMSWIRDGDGMVGWGRAAAVHTTGRDRFERASRWWRDVAGRAVVRDDVRRPGTGPVAFGSFAFRSTSAAGASLVVPQVVVGRRDGVSWVTTISSAGEIPAPARLSAQPAPVAPTDVTYADGALTGAQWSEAVDAAVRRIQGGDVDKVVLARDVDVVASAPLDARWLLSRLASSYANTWTFAVDGLTGATPELLVRREKGLVHSRILAGTIRRTGDDEHDLALAAKLARSSKDLEEHEYAVRSVADALRPHCRSMNVPEAPFVLHLPNVMHLATDVAGVLADEVSSLTLAESLHPSAAVCGTPTVTAAEVIDDLERMDRGRYAGPVGWMDGNGDGEWGIALRCGQVDAENPSRIRLFAGCGIVAGSDPDAELAESEAKLLPMRHALADD